MCISLPAHNDNKMTDGVEAMPVTFEGIGTALKSGGLAADSVARSVKEGIFKSPEGGLRGDTQNCLNEQGIFDVII